MTLVSSCYVVKCELTAHHFNRQVTTAYQKRMCNMENNTIYIQ